MPEGIMEDDDPEKMRTLLKDEEMTQPIITNTRGEAERNIITTVTIPQSEIRKYLRTAWKIAKKNGKRRNKKQ